MQACFLNFLEYIMLLFIWNFSHHSLSLQHPYAENAHALGKGQARERAVCREDAIYRKAFITRFVLDV